MTRATAAVVLTLLCAPAWAVGQYSDPATSEWFKSLASPYSHSCCDQADCRLAPSDYRIGADGVGSWWARSNWTGTWVQIVPNKITSEDSVFAQAVLCEGEPLLNTAGEYVPFVFCFAKPPNGF